MLDFSDSELSYGNIWINLQVFHVDLEDVEKELDRAHHKLLSAKETGRISEEITNDISNQMKGLNFRGKTFKELKEAKDQLHKATILLASEGARGVSDVQALVLNAQAMLQPLLDMTIERQFASGKWFTKHYEIFKKLM